MYETLTRTHDPVPLAAPTVDDAVERITAVERKKERRREGQIEDARRRREEKAKRKRDEGDEPAGDAAGEAGAADAGEGGDDALAAKKARLDDGDASAALSAAVSDADTAMAAPAAVAAVAEGAATAPTSGASSPAPARPRSRLEREQDRSMTLKAGPYARGHTSYLTFAVLLPLAEGSGAEDAAQEVPVEVAVPVGEPEEVSVA